MFDANTISSGNLWPNGPGYKSAATVRAKVLQKIVDTLLTKSAFISANHRFSGVDRFYPLPQRTQEYPKPNIVLVNRPEHDSQR